MANCGQEIEHVGVVKLAIAVRVLTTYCFALEKIDYYYSGNNFVTTCTSMYFKYNSSITRVLVLRPYNINSP